MKNIVYLAVVILLYVIVGSCKKKNQTPDNRKTFLKKEIYSFGSVAYNYNADGKLVRTDYTDNSNANNNYSTTITKYTAGGLMEEVLVDNAGATIDKKVVCTYNADGTLSKITTYRLTPSGESIETEFLYSYPSGRIIYSIRNLSSGAVIPQQETWMNIDGNISQVKYYNILGGLDETRNYTSYDNRRSAFEAVPVALAGINSKSNPLAFTRVIAGTGATTNITYTYEYNDDGYPLKRTSNSGVIATYEYIKQ
jgi:hypothetical protein